MNDKIYVVEMLIRERKNDPWCPTVGVALSKDIAQRVLKEWKEKNPNDKFRLFKYVRGK